jgi:hypothetical protein
MRGDSHEKLVEFALPKVLSHSTDGVKGVN